MNDENKLTLTGFVTRSRSLGDKGTAFTLDVPMGADKNGNPWRGTVEIVAWRSSCGEAVVGVRDTVTIHGYVKWDAKKNGLGVIAERIEVHMEGRT